MCSPRLSSGLWHTCWDLPLPQPAVWAVCWVSLCRVSCLFPQCGMLGMAFLAESTDLLGICLQLLWNTLLY